MNDEATILFDLEPDIKERAKLAFINIGESFEGEAARLCLEKEQDIVNMVKAIRRKEK